MLHANKNIKGRFRVLPPENVVLNPVSENFVGWWGNSAILLYSPKTDPHPTVVAGDAVAQNLFFCSSFELLPDFPLDTADGLINGMPDRNYFVPKPVTIKGQVTQKMLACLDGSPDYTLVRLYEHCRNLWSGYAFTGAGDGSGVQGTPASTFAPQFSVFSDMFGVYSNCLVDSIEFVANANEQVMVNYQLVSQRIWAEDAPLVRDLLTSLAMDPDALLPMSQIFSYDCGLDHGNAEQPVTSQFAVPASGSSPFLAGYGMPLVPGNEYLTKMSLKIENFLQPNFTMSSRQRWGDNRIARDREIHKRFTDNMWAHDWPQQKSRLLSAEATWITDATPHEIFQRTLGTAADQVKYVDDADVKLGQDVTMIFGPMRIRIRNPLWSLGKPKMLPDKMFEVTIRLVGASDGELILKPTESWNGA